MHLEDGVNDLGHLQEHHYKTIDNLASLGSCFDQSVSFA